MRSRLVTLLAILGLLLSACAGLPQSGPPNAVERPQQEDGGIVLDPKGPTPGASPKDIVRGFLLASSAGQTDDFSVARQFLVPEAAATWNPTTQVRIYPTSQTESISQTRSGAIRISAAALASIDENGRYTTAASDAVISSEFSLIRVAGGEWRIAVLDDGVIMPDSLFQSLYAESTLYFLTSDQSAFVPDVRWYPRNRAVTLMSQGIVAGPPSWLAGAVHTQLPAGTTLENPVVDVADGLATVDLSAEVTSLSESDIALLYAQFERTLTGNSSVRGVVLTSGGAELPPPNRVEIPSYPYSTYSLSMLDDGRPAVLAGDTVELNVAGAAIQSLDLETIAVGYTEPARQAIALPADRDTLYRVAYEDGSVTTLHTGDNLVDPTVDQYSWAWTSDRYNSRGFVAVNEETGEDVAITAQWLSGMEVLNVAVSREGARMVVVTSRDGAASLLVTAIERDGSGRPVAVGDPLRFGHRLSEIRDVSWISDSHVILIGKTATGSDFGLYDVTIGSSMQSVNSVENMVTVTSGRGMESVVLETEDGTLFGYDAGGWRILTANVTSPAYPG